MKQGIGRIEIAHKMKQGVELTCQDGMKIRIEAVTDAVVRVRTTPQDGKFPLPTLNKYGFIRADFPEPEPTVGIGKEEVQIKLRELSIKVRHSPFSISFYDASGRLLTQGTMPQISTFNDSGYRAEMAITGNEQFFGFGDQTRETLTHRGRKALMWIRNVTSYIPIPFFMSSQGYGIFVNTTWKHYFDMGATSPEKYFWETTGGTPDYYFIYGPHFETILDRYTDLTGKPPIPPLWTFGLWFICRENADDREVLDNARDFRREGIPCDIIGLEPGWMKQNYDLTTKREWHPERFKIYPWSVRGGRTFIAALKRMGFKLELWECNDYDLSFEAEKCSCASPQAEEPAAMCEEGEFPLIQDAPGFTREKMDKLTNPDEAWFEHHKKFIDMGVDFFKQDGCMQTIEHPDRLWGNGMRDEEMHNLYPLLYSRQMYEGLRGYTGKRPVCFTPNGWAGLQRFTGTWTGDTGGGAKSLAASLNLSLCGHSYTTCDMDVFSVEGIHFGFLQPWAHVNSFGTWSHPWVLGDSLMESFKFYDRLRYQLLPYLYSCAYAAHQTGMPILRPMVLEFPSDEKVWNLSQQYMLGNAFLVGAFTRRIYLPKGQWADYWSGRWHEGPGEIECELPVGRGGPLFVRGGAIIPTVTPTDYSGQKRWEELMLEVYPCEGAFVFYEDDGASLGYEKGEYALTRISHMSDNVHWQLHIGKREGCYASMPERRFEIKFHSGKKPQEVTADGVIVEMTANCQVPSSGCSCWWFDAGHEVILVKLAAPHAEVIVSF